MKATGIILFASLLFAGCNFSGFSKEERARIGTDPQAGIMRLWMTYNTEDSLLLRAQALPLTKVEAGSEYFTVLEDRMLATVNDSTKRGVGIAAPQVGISRRLIAVKRFDKPGEPFEFYINPAIDKYSATRSPGPEGCLSIEGVRGDVMRSDTITISYDSPVDFARMTEEVAGYTAVIFQHETDHLNGILFTDYLTREE